MVQARHGARHLVRVRVRCGRSLRIPRPRRGSGVALSKFRLWWSRDGCGVFLRRFCSNQYCVVIRGRVHMRIRMRLLTYSIRVPVCAYRAQLRPPLVEPLRPFFREMLFVGGAYRSFMFIHARGTRRRVSENGRVRRRHIRSRPGRLSSMVKAAAGLQQKRQSKQAALRSTRDFEKSQKQKQQAAKSGVTLEIARQRNIEKAAATAERKAIKKEKKNHPPHFIYLCYLVQPHPNRTPIGFLNRAR